MILNEQDIDKMLTFVDDESQKRSVLMQQDSVRYLNEFNMVCLHSFFVLFILFWPQVSN